MLVCYSTTVDSIGREIFPLWCKTHGIQIIEVFSKKELINLAHSVPDLLISDRTSFIFDKDWLENIGFPVVNVHPSMLPSHRGSYPIFWSALLGSKWGVTIHEVSKGIDDGPIVNQIEIPYENTWTFQDLYTKYRSVAQRMLEELVETFQVERHLVSKPQSQGMHIVHMKRETEPLLERLSKRWDTRIIDARHELSGEITSAVVRQGRKW